MLSSGKGSFALQSCCCHAELTTIGAELMLPTTYVHERFYGVADGFSDTLSCQPKFVHIVNGNSALYIMKKSISEVSTLAQSGIAIMQTAERLATACHGHNNDMPSPLHMVIRCLLQ